MNAVPPLDLAATADPRIEGERLYLRRLRQDDVSETYLGWMNEPGINRYLESRFGDHTLETLSAFVAAMSGDPLNLLAGIFLNEGDRHIGNIKLGPINPHHSRAEMGLLIGETDCWGKGYAGEAITALTEFAFNEVNLHRIMAGVYAENIGSTRAFERAGYSREACFYSHWWLDGAFQDGIMLGKVNSRHSI